MKKVYIYKMHAGMLGTDESFALVMESPLSLDEEQEYVCDHATSYQEQDEEGEWTDGDPEIWLVTTCTTKEQVEEEDGELLRGRDTLEGLFEELEKDGMEWE